MANLKAIELQSALTMERASLTLYSAPEPEIPDQLEQTRVVVDYLQDLTEHTSAPPNVERLQRLRSGELDLFFRQMTQAEIDEYWKGSPISNLNDPALVKFREEWLERQTLPPEEQLLNAFRKAQAMLWLTENGLPITWAEWDRLRPQ